MTNIGGILASVGNGWSCGTSRDCASVILGKCRGRFRFWRYFDSSTGHPAYVFGHAYSKFELKTVCSKLVNVIIPMEIGTSIFRPPCFKPVQADFK